MTRRGQTEVESQFIKALRPCILTQFWCTRIERHELQKAKESNDYTKLVEFYRRQVEAATSLLSPKQERGRSGIFPSSAITQPHRSVLRASGSPGAEFAAVRWSRGRTLRNDGGEPKPELDECYRAAGPHVMIHCWVRLISDIGHVAAHIRLSLKRLDDADDNAASRTTRRRLACELVVIMRLMLRARLYYERTDSILTAESLMVEALRGERATLPRSQLIISQLGDAVAQYDRQIRTWHIGTALPKGWKDSTDAYEFDQWGQRFSQVVPGEEGWSRFPRLLSRELRYLRSRSALRQRFHELPLSFHRLGNGSLLRQILLFLPRLIWSLAEFLALFGIVVLLWVFMRTAGFGLKPRRVAGSVTLALALFTAAYFADDTLLGRCASFSGAHFGESLYNAIANLTTLGGAPSLCGRYTGTITSIETLAGYFLLSILAAMFFVWLTDR